MSNKVDQPECSTRVLDCREIEEFVRIMKKSPGFASYSVKELQSYNTAQRIISIVLSGKVCGIAAYKNINKDWTEFTTLVMHKDFRGKGLGKKLWQAMLEKLATKNILAISANPLVKNNLALADGFVSQNFWQLTGVVQRYLIIQRLRPSKIIGALRQSDVKIREFEFFVKMR
ncbi:GNAT family N-acetyltransferase [Patescibacteria group bacterium]